MSIEFKVMEFLLGLLRNTIVGSKANQQIGRTPPDEIIANNQFPFVQVFLPEVAVSESVPQSAGSMLFNVEIFDVVGRKDALRDALEALDTTLRIDQSFQGLVRKGFVVNRDVEEHGDDELTIAKATIFCEFFDSVDSTVAETAVVGRTSFTNIVDVSSASNFTPSDCQIEDSKLIKGMLGIRRETPSINFVIVDATVSNGGLPGAGGISLAGVRRLRITTYMTPEYGKGFVSSASVQLFADEALTNGAVFRPDVYEFQTSIGWQEWIFDLTAPTTVFGAGLGTRAVIRAVRFVWPMFTSASFSSTRFGLILARAGYHLRDTGSNVDSGYHSDLILD